MFTISVETHFRASHQLVLADGSKEPVHTHDWSVAADVSCHKLNSMGLIMDFSQLRLMIDNILAEFDGAGLDKNAYFQQNNPSAENLAKYVYERLRNRLPKGVMLQETRVVEEAGCSAKFSERQ